MLLQIKFNYKLAHLHLLTIKLYLLIYIARISHVYRTCILYIGSVPESLESKTVISYRVAALPLYRVLCTRAIIHSRAGI